MRKKDQEITDHAALEEVIRRSSVCRLAMCDDGHPYVVPLCFGYEDNALYFHSAREGKKISILRKNLNVCFEFDTDCEIERTDKACAWSAKYRSVIGYGKASLVDDPELKREAFDIIMRQYSEKSFEYAEESLRDTLILKIDIEHMTGKDSGW